MAIRTIIQTYLSCHRLSSRDYVIITGLYLFSSLGTFYSVLIWIQLPKYLVVTSLILLTFVLVLVLSFCLITIDACDKICLCHVCTSPWWPTMHVACFNNQLNVLLYRITCWTYLSVRLPLKRNHLFFYYLISSKMGNCQKFKHVSCEKMNVIRR